MLAQKYGEFVKNMFPFGPFNVFPNFSFHFTWNYIMFRVWQPRGPSYTEMQGGVLVFGDLPAETKREVFRRAMHEFGPTGLLEQDDAEIWSRLNNNYLDFKRSGIVMNTNYQRSLHMERDASQIIGEGAKGLAGEHYSEVSLRGFYSTWYDYLRSEIHDQHSL
jgi:3-phenylpropionate/trans-cinnamate dioxygenase alpha subunit